MKRPLAVFGFAFLLAMFAVVQLPAGVLWPVGGLLAAVFAVMAWRWRAFAGGYGLLVCGAALLAVGAFALHGLLVLRPAQALVGQTLPVRARVEATAPGYGEDTVQATLRVLAVQDHPGQRPLLVQVDGLPTVQPGDVVELALRFSPGSAGAYGKGRYLAAAVASPVQPAGTSPTVLTAMRRLQYAASANIRARLPLRLSAVAAAMAVGDRRGVPAEITEAYRAAGLSHLMVLSGMHLSILCGGVYRLLRRVLRRRAAGALGMAFCLAFMCFAGLTPSMVRSGFVWLLLFLGGLLRRRADAATSMGLAALLLVAQNPYAAVDVGLLLSFAATAGVLAGGRLGRRLDARWTQPAPPLLRVLRWLARQALPVLGVVAATLPVLAWAGMGFTLYTLPMNLLVVPLLGPLVVLGLLMALPTGVPVLGVVGYVAAPLAGGLLVLLEKLTGLCARLPGAFLPLGGAFGLVVLLAIYAVVAVGWRVRRPVAAALAAALLLALGLGLHAGLSHGTVKLVVAGSGPNAALVVIEGRQAVVLYRSRTTNTAVQRVLRQHRVAQCVLLADIRQTAQTDDYRQLLEPTQVVVAARQVISAASYQPFGAASPVKVTLARQKNGTVACVEVAGFKVGLCTGSMDLSIYAPLDVLLAGAGQVQGHYAVLLCGTTPPAWANPQATLWYNEGEALLWLRPGRSAVYHQVAVG